MLKHIVFLTKKRMPEMETLKAECKSRDIALHFSLPEENTLIKETKANLRTLLFCQLQYLLIDL